MYIDRTRTYIGVVEDNKDPLKLCRVRIRVFNIFEQIPTTDIPWATPFKDLNGNSSNIPEIGKILTVVFDSGNIYAPEYIYAEHYNRNLEQKLSSLSDDVYLSMKALIFDSKTQIYVNDDEGLKLDYKFNNVNLTDGTIDFNLKDNFGKVNIGDSAANQQAILGTNWMNWFDTLVSALIGDQGGPYFGNLGAPVTPNPAFIAVLQQYQALRDPKFLSQNVYLNNNQAIATVRQNDNADPDLRPNDAQLGDSWTSTIEVSQTIPTPLGDYTPTYGNGTETPQSQGGLSTNDGAGPSGATVSAIIGTASADVMKIIQVMKSKGYTVETTPYYINIVGIRYQYEGDTYSDKFKDYMWAIWMDNSGNWESQHWPVSTIPGATIHGQSMKSWCAKNRPQGLGIMVPAQYKRIYQFNEAALPQSQNKMQARPFFTSVGNQQAYRDKHFDDNIIHFDNKGSLDIKNQGMFIHRGFPGGINVGSWSEGCMVFSRENDFQSLCDLARNHIKVIGKNSFHYTLLLSIDLDS